jgi:hypothetical protein
VTAINKAAISYGKARARDARAAASPEVKKKVATAKRNIGKILKSTEAGPPDSKGRQKLIIDPKVQHLLLKDKKSAPHTGTGKREPMSTGDLAELIKRTARMGETQSAQMALDISGASAGKPRMVSKDEFKKLKESDPEYAGARATHKDDDKQIREGDSYKLQPGAAHYGEGIYFATGKGAVRHVDDNYNRTGRNVISEAHIDRKSIAPYSLLSRVQSQVTEVLSGGKVDPKAPKKVLEAAKIILDGIQASGLSKKQAINSNLFFDHANIATMLGYKGYEIKNPRLDDSRYSGSYVAVLDRSALTMVQ